jgi:hypothetical protein
VPELIHRWWYWLEMFLYAPRWCHSASPIFSNPGEPRGIENARKMNLLSSFLRIVPGNLQVWENGHQIRNPPIFPNFLVYNTPYFGTFFPTPDSWKKNFPRSIVPDGGQLLTNQSQILKALNFPHFLVYNQITWPLWTRLGTADDKSLLILECPVFWVHNI